MHNSGFFATVVGAFLAMLAVYGLFLFCVVAVVVFALRFMGVL